VASGFDVRSTIDRPQEHRSIRIDRSMRDPRRRLERARAELRIKRAGEVCLPRGHLSLRPTNRRALARLLLDEITRRQAPCAYVISLATFATENFVKGT